MDKRKLTDILLKARTKTYAGEGGEVESAFNGSKQLEYREKDWLYRDIFYVGNGKFMGLETVYHKDKPVWSMSYYGNFEKMTEEEVDKILRKALVENWKTTRIWRKVEWKHGEYKYVCTPDFPGSIDEMAGMEKIFKKGKEVYFLFYAGGLVG